MSDKKNEDNKANNSQQNKNLDESANKNSGGKPNNDLSENQSKNQGQNQSENHGQNQSENQGQNQSENPKASPDPKGSGISKAMVMLSVIVAAVSLYILLAVELPKKPLAGQGGTETVIKIGGDFTLIDQDGNQFSSERLRGKMSLLYFGFTYCPDICPTSLQKITKIMEILDKYRIEITPVFITVDPNRDKVEVLKEYLGHFHNKIVGLTGDQKQIREVAEKFKVYFARSDFETEGSEYMIDHSSFIYLMDKDFGYQKHFNVGNSAEDIVEYIRINNK